mgnify:CR=1 FL=1
MKNRVKKMLVVLMFLPVMCTGILLMPQQEVYAATNGSESIMPLADILEWRYKLEKGIMYKRLYNRSQKCWIGNWIKCT